MDDSPDGTAALPGAGDCSNQPSRARAATSWLPRSGFRLPGRDDGDSGSPYIAVMDGDLQHHEGILPAMLEKIRIEKLDLVVATRNAEGGGFSKHRVWLSNLGRRLS